jgi:hypothetical protein
VTRVGSVIQKLALLVSEYGCNTSGLSYPEVGTPGDGRRLCHVWTQMRTGFNVSVHMCGSLFPC